jgi:hypothetical protein
MSLASPALDQDDRPVLVAVCMRGPTASLVRAGIALPLRRQCLTCRIPQGVGNDVGLHLVDALLARSVSARPRAPLHEPRGHVCLYACSACQQAAQLSGFLVLF